MSMIDGLKTAGKVLQEAGKIEQYQMILDAQQRMLEMQQTITELTEESKPPQAHATGHYHADLQSA